MKIQCKNPDCQQWITPLFDDEPYCDTMCKHKFIQNKERDEEQDNTYD